MTKYVAEPVGIHVGQYDLDDKHRILYIEDDGQYWLAWTISADFAMSLMVEDEPEPATPETMEMMAMMIMEILKRIRELRQEGKSIPNVFVEQILGAILALKHSR
jgi:hypothetical protein